MLRQLLIENYGLIESARITFDPGATVFTGETGSGKTMLLGALGFVLGERASADVVRRGAPRAAVTLALDPDDALRARFEAGGFALDPDEEATIAREITETGKSSARLNGRPTTAGAVRELANAIADAVGQHEAQRLLVPAYHGELLDRFGGEPIAAARDEVAQAHAALHALIARLGALEGEDRRARERYDDARAALDEIEATAIEQGEDERLTRRRRLLDNVERVAIALRAAHDALAGDDAGASSALGAASASLYALAGFGDELEAMAARAQALQSDAGDLATQIARQLDATEFDPSELERINARLDALDRLKRKYGGALDAVLAHAQRAREIVGDFDGRDEQLAELRARHEIAVERLRSAAAKLTELRRKAAAALQRGVAVELSTLALASARFELRFEALDAIGAGGAERVEFVFAANAGEPVRPLARVTSGGELSRVLLALIVTLAGRRDRAALIFDEIDAGIGGATATAVGERLTRLARENQVVCVTHLAQIAACAQRQYVLEKHEKKESAAISVRELTTAAQREAELARMLSGETHDIALRHARTLLRRREG